MSKYMPFNTVDDYKIKLQEAKITLGFSPTADVVEVVRCKNCRHYHKEKGGWCEKHDFEFDVGDYCCHGERITYTEEPNANDNH